MNDRFCSLSDGLVAARMVLATTEKRLWAKALTAFWHVYTAIEDAVEAAGDSKGKLLSVLLDMIARGSMLP